MPLPWLSNRYRVKSIALTNSVPVSDAAQAEAKQSATRTTSVQRPSGAGYWLAVGDETGMISVWSISAERPQAGFRLVSVPKLANMPLLAEGAQLDDCRMNSSSLDILKEHGAQIRTGAPLKAEAKDKLLAASDITKREDKTSQGFTPSNLIGFALPQGSGRVTMPMATRPSGFNHSQFFAPVALSSTTMDGNEHKKEKQLPNQGHQSQPSGVSFQSPIGSSISSNTGLLGASSMFISVRNEPRQAAPEVKSSTLQRSQSSQLAPKISTSSAVGPFGSIMQTVNINESSISIKSEEQIEEALEQEESSESYHS
jgi:hypothetical protein